MLVMYLNKPTINFMVITINFIYYELMTKHILNIII